MCPCSETPPSASSAQPLDALEGGPHRMSGFLTNGAFSITKEPFGDWAKSLAKITAGLQPRLEASIDQVMAGMERGLQDEIRSHPAWPNDLADKTSVQVQDGEYQVQVNDPRAHGLEFGNDPEHAASPLIEPYGATMEPVLGQKIESLVRREVGL